MLDPVSVTLGTCMLGYAALYSHARGGSAISDEALIETKAASAIVERVETSWSLFGDKGAAISQVLALADDCSVAGWDGDEAPPVASEAVQTVCDFVRALPEGFPLPEFAPEPDGSISLDWIRSKQQLISLSIGSGERVPYAWVDGTDKGHAVGRFDGFAVQQRLLSAILSIVG